MPRPKSATLTDVEAQLMDVLWRLGEGRTRDVLAALPESENRAYSTIRTTLRILEEKGYLTHREKGRAYVYVPAVERQEVRQRAVRHLLGRFFGGSAEQLVLNVLEEQKLTPEDRRRIRELVGDLSEVE